MNDVYVEEDQVINRFTYYGMDSVMFLYVFIYKSVLIAIICCVLFVTFVILQIIV